MPDPGLPLRLRERADVVGCPWRSTAATAMRERADAVADEVDVLARRVHDAADALARTQHLAAAQATALVEAATTAAARADDALERLARQARWSSGGQAALEELRTAADRTHALAAELAHRAAPAREVLRDLAG